MSMHRTSAQDHVLAALRASDSPQSIAAITRLIGARFGVRYARPTVSGALGRLARDGAVSYFDDGPQSSPRQWFATTTKEAS